MVCRECCHNRTMLVVNLISYFSFESFPRTSLTKKITPSCDDRRSTQAKLCLEHVPQNLPGEMIFHMRVLN